jgi:hypothetical protein
MENGKIRGKIEGVRKVNLGWILGYRKVNGFLGFLWACFWRCTGIATVPINDIYEAFYTCKAHLVFLR